MANKTEGFIRDGYLHWAEILDAVEDGPFAIIKDTRPPEKWLSLQRMVKTFGKFDQNDSEANELGPLYEPLFVQWAITSEDIDNLKAKSPEKEDQKNELQKKVIDEINTLSGLALPNPKAEKPAPYILDFFDLSRGIENAIQAGQKLEFFLYRLADNAIQSMSSNDKFDIIDIGPTVTLNPLTYKGSVASPKPQKSDLTIGAVIDNDIGFLNDAFCKPERGGKKTTRFESIWLQSRRRRRSEEPRAIDGEVLLGQTLKKSDIDKRLNNSGTDEATKYREINEPLHLWERFRKSPLKNTHGTAVAALAYGNDFFDIDASDHCDVPLLAVQLPPEAAADTSGTYSESFIVQGVRWLCWKARHMSNDATLVINISYGVLAGPKDGSKFLEDQIRREIICAEKLGLTVHVVYAFGNSRNQKQIAQVTAHQGDWVSAPDWVIPRGQRLPSFVEIRALDPNREKLIQVPKGIDFILKSPSGLETCFTTTNAQPDSSPMPTSQAQFFYVPDRNLSALGRRNVTGMVQISVAPTIPLITDEQIPIAENGDWTLKIENKTNKSVTFVLQIQRGDKAPGFVNGGVQSYFEGAYVRTDAGRDVEMPLTNSGTNSAYTTGVYSKAANRRIHTVGAHRTRVGDEVPTDYSAQAASWSTPTDPEIADKEFPTDTKIVDGTFSYGKAVTGTYSGSRTRLSGTSAAAALKSRELAK